MGVRKLSPGQGLLSRINQGDLQYRGSLCFELHFFNVCLHLPITLSFPQVLAKFLEVYSSFEWERVGLSLQGALDLDALPQMKGELPVLAVPGNQGKGLA